MDSLPIYAGMLCNQVGLKFTMGGSIAWSAGGQINLPALPYNNPKSQRLAYGMIMHEGGHESHTDYQAWDTIKHDPAAANMVNRLEDIRIEKKQIDRFPGAKSKLQDMVSGLCEMGYWTAPSDKDSPTTLLGKAILYRLRASVLSQDALAAWGNESMTRLEEAIPKHLAAHLTTIAAQVVWCQNTAEVVELAANILDLLQQEKDKLEEEQSDPQQSQAQNGQSQGQSGQGQGNSQDPSQGQSDPSQGNDPAQGSGDPQQGQDPAAGQSQGQGGQPDPGNQSGASSGTQTGGNTGSGGEPVNGDPNGTPSGNAGSSASGDPQGDPQAQAKARAKAQAQAQAIERILKGEEDSAPGDVGKSVCDALSSMGGESNGRNIAMPEARKADLETGETAEILARVRNASRALQTRAYRIFEATAHKKRKFKEEGRRVDVSRLWRPKTGDYRVFVEKEETPRVNTAVQLLVDISNSMNAMDRLQPAIDSALALAMALSKLNGVKVATATFPAVNASMAAEEERVSYIHTFDQRPELHAKRYAAMWSHAYTPTAEALLWAGRELLGRKETRKIVFVLTDGMPEMPCRDSSAYRRLTVEVRESLEQEGVEVVGLGIGIDVSQVFPTSVAVNSLDELAGGVFSLMSKTLFKKAA